MLGFELHASYAYISREEITESVSIVMILKRTTRVKVTLQSEFIYCLSSHHKLAIKST